ncbi:MAG: cell division protein SepF [Methanotrichaceae archaeon]
MGILDKLMGRSGEEDYVDIDLGQFEDVSVGSFETLVRVAELNSIDVLPEIEQEIENKNIILVDITPMKRENTLLDQIIKELKAATEGSGGDIVGVGDDLILIVPKGLRIDRKKILGGVD